MHLIILIELRNEIACAQGSFRLFVGHCLCMSEKPASAEALMPIGIDDPGGGGRIYKLGVGVHGGLSYL